MQASHGSIKYCKKFIEMDRSAKLSALTNSKLTCCKHCLRIPDHQDSSKRCKDTYCLNCGAIDHHHLLCKEGKLTNEQFRIQLTMQEEQYEELLEREDFIDIVLGEQNIEPSDTEVVNFRREVSLENIGHIQFTSVLTVGNSSKEVISKHSEPDIVEGGIRKTLINTTLYLFAEKAVRTTILGNPITQNFVDKAMLNGENFSIKGFNEVSKFLAGSKKRLKKNANHCTYIRP